MPHLPPITSSGQALNVLHMARTSTNSIPIKLRQYSHQWLTDRAMPSGLPDHLKPNAEQAGNRIVDTVGISVNSSEPEVSERIATVMEYAVMDAYSDNQKNPHFVRQRMLEARMKERRALGLRSLPNG